MKTKDELNDNRVVHDRSWDGCLYKFAGTLAWRDGFKTGPGTPNGQDAWDQKLVIRWMLQDEPVESKSGRVDDHDAKSKPVYARQGSVCGGTES